MVLISKKVSTVEEALLLLARCHPARKLNACRFGTMTSDMYQALAYLATWLMYRLMYGSLILLRMKFVASFSAKVPHIFIMSLQYLEGVVQHPPPIAWERDCRKICAKQV